MPEEAARPIDIAAWNDSLTEPTESIIQAAQRLFGSHDVREIDHAQADNTDEAVQESFASFKMPERSQAFLSAS
jgi:hypothetical protein